MRNRFEYRIFFKYLLMYLCAVAAFIILLIPIYTTMYNVTKANTVEEEVDKIYRDVSILDSKIEKITTISSHIKNDSNFLKLSNISGALKPNEYIYLIQAQQALNDLRKQYDLDLFAYVLFENNDIFISETKTAVGKNTYSSYVNYEENDLDTIRNEALYTGRDMRFIPIQHITYVNDETIEGLTCIVKVSNQSYSGVDYAIIYTIDMNALTNSIGNMEQGSGFLQIADRKGNTLLNYNYDGEAIEFQNQNIRDYQLDGETYTLVHAVTEYGNLNVVQGIKETVFEEKITSVLRIIQIYVITAILLSIMISLLLSFRQFSGVRRILGVIRPKPDVPQNGNEYKYIYSSVRDLSDENKKYEEDIMAIRASMKNRLIEKMFLQGIYARREKAEFANYTRKQIGFFCVVSMVFAGEDLSEQMFLAQYGKLIHYMRTRIEQEYHQSISVVYGMGEIITLVLLQDDSPEHREKIYTFMKELAREALEMFEKRVEIGISNIGFDISNVHAGYLQSKRAIRQIGGQFENSVRMASGQNGGAELLEDFSVEQLLFDLIVTEDKEGIQSLFQRLNQYIQQYAFSSEQEIMQMFFLIRSHIINAKRKILKEGSGIRVPDYDVNSSISKLMEGLEESAQALCDYSLEKKKKSDTALKKAVIQYVNEQYVNADLCASMVAEVFSVSEKYIFRLVKEETCQSFGKYVESVRLKKAKELLLETDHSAAEISKMVGFYSITTFYKAFHRVFGVAPVAWRKNVKK